MTLTANVRPYNFVCKFGGNFPNQMFGQIFIKSDIFDTSSVNLFTATMKLS